MSNAFHTAARILRGGDEKTATVAIILAAGNSTRMGKGQNKQFLKINDTPVLAYTMMAYQACPHIRDIIIVAREEDFDAIRELGKKYQIKKLKKLVAGGSTRQESAKRGVAQISEEIKYVAIADGARCLTTPEEISKICMRAYQYKAASAAHQITSSVKRATLTGKVQESVNRTGLWETQTPQVFHAALYNAALCKAVTDNFTATDDNELVTHLGYQVKLVECGMQNLKITTPDDLFLAKAVISLREQEQKEKEEAKKAKKEKKKED